MSYIINPYRFGVAAAPLYDGVSTMYTLRIPDMTTLWTNAILKIRRSSDNATAFVFGGSTIDSTITLSSFVSTTSDTTPSATTLSTWLGSNSAFVERWYGITDNNTISTGKRLIQTTTANQPIFAGGTGVIRVKNGKPYIDFFTDTRNLEAGVNNDLDSTDDFTILTVTHNTVSGNIGAFMTLANISSTFNMHSNRSTSALRISHFINVPITVFETALLASQNNADQKLLTTILNSGTMSSYYNGTFQETVVTSGTYTNDRFVLGRRFDASRLDGGIQEIIIFPSDIAGDRTTIETDIDSYYSIP